MAKIIADGVEYEAEKFTLGEFRVLKADFGLETVEKMDLGNPDHLVGVLFILARRQNPDVTLADIEAVTEVTIKGDEPDPTVHSLAASSDAPADAPEEPAAAAGE